MYAFSHARLLVFAVLALCASCELGLTNYKRVLDALPLLSRNPNFTKQWYYQRLEELGVSSGPQVAASNGLCPYADGVKHKLLTPTCLRDKGYKYVLFIGDSLVRELAWSLARLSSSVPGEPCQQGAVLHQRFNHTGDGPQFACTSASMDAHTLCGVEDMTGSSDMDCCSDRFSTHYYGYVLPWFNDDPKPHETQFGTSSQASDTINRFQDSCSCKGLLVINYGMWIVVDGGNTRMVTERPVQPWSLPFGRREGLLNLIGQFHRPNSLLHTVLASTPQTNSHIMTLDPTKGGWEAWGNLALEFMASVDKDVAALHNFTYLPYHEVTSNYGHVQCDGMHFGNLYHRFGCRGFSVVTDVVTQHLLNDICPEP